MIPKLLIGAVVIVVAAAAGWAVFVRNTQPDEPGSFYTAPSPLPAGPNGTIIRKEVIDGFHEGATTYRVLYKSTGYDGTAAAVSGLIIVPDGDAPAGGRKVLAYAHGTLGVAPSCAPSLRPGSYFSLLLPGLDAFLKAGDVVAATDYQGLGTPGPSPYLVGDAEASDVLDSVRAARGLTEAHAGSDFAVYGESQGGHSALFTGQLAHALAPELHLVGVVSAEPASDLVELLSASEGTTVGNILTAMALSSWAGVYQTARLQDIVTPVARPLVSKIAGFCIQNPNQILASVPAATALQLTFLSHPPWEKEPWRTILADNTPRAEISFPLLVAQGLEDHVVAPAVQDRFVKELCQRGAALEYRTYPGAGHLDLPSIASGDITRWIADRFAGAPARNTCD
jgi:acetyl esterase/lipase